MKTNRAVPQWRLQPCLKECAGGFALHLQFPLPRPVGNKFMDEANSTLNRVNLDVPFARHFRERFGLVAREVIELRVGCHSVGKLHGELAGDSVTKTRGLLTAYGAPPKPSGEIRLRGPRQRSVADLPIRGNNIECLRPAQDRMEMRTLGEQSQRRKS